jgi:NADP-dependent 3-hydroxy acid dehydrogenase YdfG
MKSVLITGGSDGLGKATAQKLIAAGYDVTILGRDEERTKAAAKEMGCKYVVADIANNAQVEKAIAAAGDVDILINNAGLWIQDELEANDPDYIQKVVEVNALGTMYCTRAVVPFMKERGRGRIINVISQAGLYAKAERAPYNASKWAVTGFTKSMQAELQQHKIAVTGFYPSALNTHMFDKSGNSRDMSRALEPEIAAGAIAYICSLPDHVTVPELGIASLNYHR